MSAQPPESNAPPAPFINSSSYEAGAVHNNPTSFTHNVNGNQVNIITPNLTPEGVRNLFVGLSPEREEPPSTPTTPDTKIPKELEAISSEVENELKAAIMNFMSKGHTALAPTKSATE